MATRKRLIVDKKEGEITRSERSSANRQAQEVLKKAKEQAGSVVHITISEKITIELPANLSQKEIDERIEKYHRLHHK